MYKTYSENDLDLIVKELEQKKVLITNTDTIIGILAIDENDIFKIKERPIEKKIVRFIKDTKLIKNLNEKQKDFLNQFWPGQVTIIKNGISYRQPKNKFILSLLDRIGILYCSSANISNTPVINTIFESMKMFGKKWQNKIILAYQKSFLATNMQSTVIDIDTWEIIRPGFNIFKIQEYLEKKK